MNLYTYPDALARLWSLADESGELPPDLEAELDRLGAAFDDTASFIVRRIRECQAQAAAAKAELDAIAEYRARQERQAKRLENYLLDVMRRMGLKRAGEGAFAVTRTVNSVPSVNVDCEAKELPERFWKVSVDADMAALRKAFEAGEELPPGVTVERGEHLRMAAARAKVEVKQEAC